MQFHHWALGLTAIALANLIVVPATFAQDSTSLATSTGQDERSPPRQALEWSQDRLAELDATIAELEQDAAQREGEAREKAEAALERLRTKRDAYRAKAEEAAANARQWSEDQVREAQETLDRTWAEFQSELSTHLDAVQADLATRRAVLEAELESGQRAWHEAIDDLRTKAEQLDADQRAAMEARIEALNAQLTEARDRADRLRDASREGWEKTKKGYAEARQIAADTYASIRKDMEDAVQ